MRPNAAIGEADGHFALVGVALINTYIPMAGSIKSLLNAVIAVVVWLLKVLGLWGSIMHIGVGK